MAPTNLGDDVRNNVSALEAAAGPEPDGDSAVKMPTRNVADRICHSQYGQSEGKADPQETDAQRRKGCGQHRTAATGKC